MKARMDDIQPYVDKLREGDLMGFLGYLNYITDKYQLGNTGSEYSADKHLQAIIIWEFMKSNIDIKDIQSLLNYEILTYDLSQQSLDANSNLYRIQGNVKDARRALFTILCYKEDKNLSKTMSQFTHLSAKPATLQELVDLIKITDASRDEVSKSMDKLKLKKLGNFYIKMKDKKGNTGVRDNYSQYSKSKTFQKFCRNNEIKLLDDIDRYQRRTRNKRSTAITERPKFSMFSSSSSSSEEDSTLSKSSEKTHKPK